MQRFAIGMVCIQEADMYAGDFSTLFLLTVSYLFDEPSSYLDVKQRLKAALAIRNVIGDISNLKQKYTPHD